MTGLEPAASCSQSKHSPKLSYTSIDGVEGVEPSHTESKSVALPLGYTPENKHLKLLNFRAQYIVSKKACPAAVLDRYKVFDGNVARDSKDVLIGFLPNHLSSASDGNRTHLTLIKSQVPRQ